MDPCFLHKYAKLNFFYCRDDNSIELLPTWHIYVTGHSLGGALATLLALELASSQLAQSVVIQLIITLLPMNLYLALKYN